MDFIFSFKLWILNTYNDYMSNENPINLFLKIHLHDQNENFVRVHKNIKLTQNSKSEKHIFSIHKQST